MCFNLSLRIFVLYEKWFIGRENYGKENVECAWQALETPELRRGGGEGVLDISLGGEMQLGPSYPDPV